MAAASALHHRVLVLECGLRRASRVAVGSFDRRKMSHFYTSVSSIQPGISLPLAARDARRRFFHNTPVRRLFEAPEQAVAVCVGIASGWIIMGFIRRIIAQRAAARVSSRALPPASWVLGHDHATLAGTTIAVETGFNMARSQPPERQHEAFREATFQLPYEVARLNKDAPEFQLQDMGPVPPIPEAWRKFVARALADPVFDPQTDVRVFLYFPNGATKATAAFVAINTEFAVSGAAKRNGINMMLSTNNAMLFKQALNSWTAWYLVSSIKKPDILEQVKPGKIPVIFLFRDKASTCVFDTESQTFENLASMSLVLGLGEKMPGGTW